MSSSQNPVTVVLSRRIQPGQEQVYRQWVRESTETMQRFPEFLGTALNEPSEVNPKWVFLTRCETTDHLEAWDASPELQERIRELVPLLDGGTDRQHHQGLDMWFPPPTPDAPRPAAWKMMVVTLVALWPTILVLSGLLAFVPELNALPWWLGPLPMLIVLVPLLEYAIMPGATKLFSKWLFP